VQRSSVVAERRSPPLAVVLAIAVFSVALVVGGVVWWRMRDTGTGDAPPPAPAAAAQPQTDPLAAAQPQAEPVTALPFVGEWVVEKDFSNPDQLPDVGIIRFGRDRFRFKDVTNTVHYLARGDSRFGIRFRDDEGEASGGHAADEDPLTVVMVDTDHVLLSSQEFDLALVRRDSPAGQAFLAKVNAVPSPAPSVAPPAPSPAAKPVPSPVANAAQNPIQLAINASLDEGRRCMASNKYDCAISSANAVLRLAPRNSAALAMKRKAEAAQARALSEIEIR